jgi:rhamnose utilization protein RhaD (predicted bifunctional aldolase and dehydrogenase)
VATELELKSLQELTERAGRDPLLTQASTGNCSAKLDGILWIKASGKWMADATQDDILIPLNLGKVTTCLRRGLDPSEWFAGASLETAMHAALPHRIILHVHSVDTIAWAVRKDVLSQLEPRLTGLAWQWIPYVASGLPLSREIERVLSIHPDTNLFVLGNHGLVIGADDVGQAECLLNEVRRRLHIAPRRAHPADYSVLSEACEDSPWDIPDDDDVHALATDAISRAILAGGLLYPCQAIFSGVGSPALFWPVPYRQDRVNQYVNRPFLLIDECGVVVNRSIRPAELAMISGLAKVVQRLDALAPIRYLTAAETARISCNDAYRYRDLANASRNLQAGSHQ